MATISLTYLALFICAVGSSLITSISGIGGGVILVALMTIFLPLTTVIPIHGIVQLVSNSSRSALMRRDIVWPFFIFYTLGLPVGLYVGYFVIENFNFELIATIFLVLLIFYTVFKPGSLPGLKIPYFCFIFVGAIAGFLGLFIGAPGPLLAPFLLRDDFSKKQIVASKSIAMTATHIGKIPVFLALDFAYHDYWMLILVLSVAAILGASAGVSLLNGISESLFRKIFKLAMVLVAVRLLYVIYPQIMDLPWI